MFTKTIRNADHEITLLFRNRAFVRIYGPGVHRISRLGGRTELVTVDLRPVPVEVAVVETLALTNPGAVAAYFAVADMADGELGLVFADGKLVDLVAPGQRAFYARGLREIEIRRVDAQTELEVPDELLAPLSRAPFARSGLVRPVAVENDTLGLLYVDGVLTRQLAPGRYAFYQAVRRVEVFSLDLRLQTLEVTGQEVLTRDQIAIRANLTAGYRVIDPVRAVSLTTDLRDYLYKELQFALRRVVGTRTLDEVLGDKQGINAAIEELLLPALAAAGLEASSVGIKDIILPGDVRELMNRVIEAEKNARANVIKRREETAATRSLLNTAKLMEDNPILLRLKELEALEKVSEKISNVVVGNGMDGVIGDLVRIRPRAERG